MSELTFAEKVRKAWPGASDDELEDLLWSATSFPFGTEAQIMAQLNLSYTTTNGNIGQAIDDAHHEIETAMQEYRELYPVNPNQQVDLSNG